jgi:hypothetical protein
VTTFRADPNVLSRKVGEETVLVQLDRNEVFALNVTGARFWELLSSGSSRAEAVDTMLIEFEVTRPELESEVESLVDELVAKGLVFRDDA